jgi:hypothetical protein
MVKEEKWNYWVKITKEAIHRNDAIHNEDMYWFIMINFARFFDCDLGFEGNPKQFVKGLYGELFASYLFSLPQNSWMRKKMNAKEWLDKVFHLVDRKKWEDF